MGPLFGGTFTWKPAGTKLPLQKTIMGALGTNRVSAFSVLPV